MEKITSFNELALLLLETKWDQGESPLAKIDGDFIVFTQKGKRVDRREKFKLKLGDQEVEYNAEQIVHCYRTRDLNLNSYLRDSRNMKKISSVHRPTFLAMMMQDGAAFFTAALAAAPTAATATSSSSALSSGVFQDDESARKRERLDKGERQKTSTTTTTTSTTTSSSSRAPTKLADVLKHEVRYFDRNSALNAVRSFQEVIDLDTRAKTTEEEHNLRGSKQKRGGKPLGSPIIVVPPNPSAVLNLYNIKSFLEDMTYVSADEVKKKQPDLMKPEFVYVTRRKHAQAGDIRFKVVDSVLNFDAATWDRVVAVVVSGQAWQLKGWKWATPAEIFANVKGLYVYFDDAKLTDQLKGWNVVALPIKHQSRNKDIVQVHEIWRQVDAHMERKRPLILQQLVDEHETRQRAEKEARQKGMQAQMDEEEEDEDDGDNEGGPSAASQQQQQEEVAVGTAY